jgi:hypothetical protein
MLKLCFQDKWEILQSVTDRGDAGWYHQAFGMAMLSCNKKHEEWLEMANCIIFK